MPQQKNVERIERIRQMASEDMAQSMIASIEGVTRERIRQICAKEGIYTASGHIDYDMRDALCECADQGMTLSEAAVALSVGRNVAYHMARRFGIEFPPPSFMWHKLRDLAAHGLSLSECARRIGRTPQTAWSMANAHGITFAKKDRCPRPVEVNGHRYGSMLEASRAVGVTPATIANMVKTGRASFT